MDISVSAPMYASLGYDFLAVTDHNRAPSQDQWQRWQDQTPLILIPGEENGHTDHIVELGVYQVTPTPSAKYIDRARALRKGDGFVFAAHPQE